MDDFPPLQKVEFNLSYEMSVPFECDATEGVVYNLKSVLKLLQKAESIVLDSVAVEMLVEYIDPCSMKNGGVTFGKLSHLRLNGKVKNPTHILTPL
ncbi:F-box/LRR-repeat protein [Cucumis melo var. makuwa]|uniref:F-box/LRR-repeat protein n=1 Tax=Cucumis melo var. makuwa TaxID=1194695 RepID=A0A5A7T704_CUCMM|nr:F-box/LRR-repeat protein [Cucumis melo var. makuwa]TYK00450.1 F-box/LRR-repeat protein [Cucumis melo var. makuwa]